MWKVFTLRFLTWMMDLSGSSQKMETTRVISDRGNLCRKLASQLFHHWVTKQTDGTSVVARAGGTVPRDGFTRAVTWSSNQWPGGTTEGGASGGAGGAGATEETRLLPELVLKTERERTK